MRISSFNGRVLQGCWLFSSDKRVLSQQRHMTWVRTYVETHPPIRSCAKTSSGTFCLHTTICVLVDCPHCDQPASPPSTAVSCVFLGRKLKSGLQPMILFHLSFFLTPSLSSPPHPSFPPSSHHTTPSRTIRTIRSIRLILRLRPPPPCATWCAEPLPRFRRPS